MQLYLHGHITFNLVFFFCKVNSLDLFLLPYGQVSNSVIQSDRLKTCKCDVMMGHYYPVIPAH